MTESAEEEPTSIQVYPSTKKRMKSEKRLGGRSENKVSFDTIINELLEIVEGLEKKPSGEA